MSRDIQEAARHLFASSQADLLVIAKRDPDMIRDVAQAAMRPIWRKHDLHCAINDSEFGPCSCGADHEADKEFRRAINLRGRP